MSKRSTFNGLLYAVILVAGSLGSLRADSTAYNDYEFDIAEGPIVNISGSSSTGTAVNFTFTVEQYSSYSMQFTDGGSNSCAIFYGTDEDTGNPWLYFIGGNSPTDVPAPSGTSPGNNGTCSLDLVNSNVSITYEGPLTVTLALTINTAADYTVYSNENYQFTAGSWTVD